ncbi:hypothetical protein HDR67_02310 [bacterium]|nr:hypothetical protein [bacterium]
MEEGLSLVDIWILIMKKKIVASIVFGITTILSFVLILFVLNPMRTSYEAIFQYQWYGIEENKYANGVLFNFQDMISLEHLEEVKSLREEYQDIDVKGLAESISIERNEKTYRIVVGGSFFPSNSIAKAFIEDLVSLPYEKALHLKLDFKANLIGYARAKKISTKLMYLDRQMDLITEGYQGMISYFGDILIKDAHLSSKFSQAQVFESNYDLNNYEYLAYQNVYLTKEEYQSIVTEKNALTTEQSLLRQRKAVLLESLSNIYSNSNGNTYMDTSIAGYLNSLHTIDTRLMQIDEDLRLMEQASLGKYSEEKSELFLKELEVFKNDLEALTDEYTESVQSVLEENTVLTVQPIRVKGRIGTLLAICISLLLGIVAGLFTAFIWSYLAKYKQEHMIKEE